MNSFTQQDKVGRAIIVITDGEDHEGGAIEAAEAARKRHQSFYPRCRRSQRTPIPTGNGGYMKDNSGQTVMSALNEQMCQQIAQAGKGTYIHVDNTSDAEEKLNDELAKLQKGETSSVIYSEYDEQFQAFAILALILLVIETFIMESRNPLLRKVSLFRRRYDDKETRRKRFRLQ